MDLWMYDGGELKISAALCKSQVNKQKTKTNKQQQKQQTLSSANVPSVFVNGKRIPLRKRSRNDSFWQEMTFREETPFCQRSLNVRFLSGKRTFCERLRKGRKPTSV